MLADFDVSKDTLRANAPMPAGAAAAGRPEEGGGGGGSVSMAGDSYSSVPGGGGGGNDGGEPGVSRQMSESETTMTSLVGTHGFMAPEVGWVV